MSQFSVDCSEAVTVGFSQPSLPYRAVGILKTLYRTVGLYRALETTCSNYTPKGRSIEEVSQNQIATASSRRCATNDVNVFMFVRMLNNFDDMTI